MLLVMLIMMMMNSLFTCTKAERVNRPIAIQVTMATMLDRESRREKILSAIQKEARLKVRTEDHKAHLEFLEAILVLVRCLIELKARS